LHWVDAKTAIDAEVRLYENLFSVADPDAPDREFTEHLNENSLTVCKGCKIEASVAGSEAPASYQFLRKGYFCLDSTDSRPDHLVFNRSVSLKDRYRPPQSLG
jgi:glutaminyl-tRNA synthetase